MARQSWNGEPLDFEDPLWRAADRLRRSMDASEYKHVVLGLAFLKYINDAFTERRAKLAADLVEEGITGEHGTTSWSPETSTRARASSVSHPEARWDFLQSKAKQPEIANLIDSVIGQRAGILLRCLPERFGSDGTR